MLYNIFNFEHDCTNLLKYLANVVSIMVWKKSHNYIIVRVKTQVMLGSNDTKPVTKRFLIKLSDM